MLSGLLTFIGLAIAIVWLVAAYNQLSALRQRVNRAWLNIDALVRERHEELTKLAETCAAPLSREQEALEGLAEARAEVLGARHARSAESLGRAEGELRRRLADLLARADASAELAANPGFALLRQRLAALNGAIGEARADYNAVVSENNVAIEQFPQRVVAAIAGFRPLPLLPLAANGDAPAAGES